MFQYTDVWTDFSPSINFDILPFSDHDWIDPILHQYTLGGYIQLLFVACSVLYDMYEMLQIFFPGDTPITHLRFSKHYFFPKIFIVAAYSRFPETEITF